MDDIVAWLESLGLAEYAPAFVENRIDAAILPTLTEQDLKDIGVIRLGDRRKLTMAIAERTKAPTSAESASAPPPSALPQDTASTSRPPSAERRHLTVMFCDLVGSTALAARLDPEDVREVVRAYQGACAQAIARYDGFVAQYLGDGIMAYFGYPTAHEDEAERAVRAGLELVAAVAKLDAKTKVEVRVGIATGLVVVGDLIGEHAAKERAVTGETPNLAARLQGLAAPGSILVSTATRRLLGGMFELRDLGTQSVKGLDAPVTAFAVEGVLSFESRFEARAGGLTGFVGREEECEHLLDRWKLARQGRGQVVLVSGEAGIGKSRLTAWLVDKVAGEPHTRMRYQCTPHHKDSALYPTIAQIERAAGIEANETAEEKLAKLEALLTLAKTEAAETVPLFAALLTIPTGEKYPPLAMSPGQQRQRTLAAMLDQIEGLARQKPLLMIYEDAHWADATSLELLDSLVDRLTRLPVLFVVTGRPEFSPPWAGRHNVSTLYLQKLDKRQTRAMVESVTGGTVLPAEVLEQIVAKTDGVPLFVEELTKTVLESGLITEGDDRPAGPLPSFAIPATLQDSLMARLDRSNPVKEIAQIGAAIGREFSYQLLLAVAGMSEASVREALAKLEEAELAGRRGVPPDATYTFKHALVQDAAYESLLKSRRRTIHRRIAKALRDHFPLVAETEPEIIAHHFAQAGRTDQAVEWWTSAGKRAHARSAYAEAIGHFDRALLADGTARSTVDSRLALQVARAHALTAKYGYGSPLVWNALRDAIQADSMSDSLDFLALQYGLFSCLLVRGEAHKALAKADICVSHSGRFDAALFQVFGRSVRGSSKWLSGDFIGAEQDLGQIFGSEEWRSSVPTPFDETETSSIRFLAYTLFALGDIHKARQVADTLLPRTQTLQGRVHNLARNYFHLAVFEALHSNTKRTMDIAQFVIDLSNEHDLPIWRAYGLMLSGWAKCSEEDRSSGLQMLQQAREYFVVQDTVLYLKPFLDGLWAQVTCCDNPEAAHRCLTAAVENTMTTGQRWYDAELLRHRARSTAHITNTLAASEGDLHQALTIARAQHARTFELRASLDLARLYCDMGREREAVPLLQGALVGFTETPELPEIGEANRLLASLP